MGPPFIAMGFGLVIIAAFWTFIVFYRAWKSPLVEVDARYNVVIIALMVGTVGAALWAVNPLAQALGYAPLDGWLLFIASLLIFAASSTLIASTAMGATRTMVKLYAASAAVWVIGVLIWWYVL